MQLLQNEAAEYLLTRAQKWWHVPVTSEPQVRGTPHPPAFPRPPRLGGRALFCASSANGLVRSLACHRFHFPRAHSRGVGNRSDTASVVVRKPMPRAEVI